jgi:hypothetical protein
MGDPPPDPRFLASIGAMSLVGLANRVEEGLREGLPPVIMFPGGSSPRPPFSSFARRAVIGWAS